MAMAGPMAKSDNRDRISTAIAVLRRRFGDRLQTGEAIRRQHANTLTWIPNQPPDAVIWAETTDEVREIVRIAATHGTPIIPFGAGTSLEGHINAPRGGLSLDFGRMNRILSVNERDLDCVVEAGVSRKQLNDYLRDLGLFFPVDPGAEEATIGRYGVHARFGHDRRALWHHARERPQHHGRDGGRLDRQNRPAGA